MDLRAVTKRMLSSRCLGSDRLSAIRGTDMCFWLLEETWSGVAGVVRGVLDGVSNVVVAGMEFEDAPRSWEGEPVDEGVNVAGGGRLQDGNSALGGGGRDGLKISV